MVVIIIRLIFLLKLEKFEIIYFANHYFGNIQGPPGSITLTEVIAAQAGDMFADAFLIGKLSQTRNISTKDWEIKMNLVKKRV